MKTITDDIKEFFQNGNMLTKIILVNIIVFVTLVLLRLIFRSSFGVILSNLTLSSDLTYQLLHPWTIFTHMIVHIDLFHMLFNMFVYYWFGNIVGDLIGDRKVLPLYILGGIAGFLFFSIYSYLVSANAIAFGASAAVMASVSAAAFIAPDYKVRLMFFGEIPIKFIALGYVIIDLAMISDQSNIGGHISHIGGLLMGVLFVYMLKQGVDLSKAMNRWLDQFGNIFSKNKKPILRISHSSKRAAGKSNKKKNTNSTIKNKIDQHDVDILLDKVKKKGYDSLTAEEKETLFIASRQNES